MSREPTDRSDLIYRICRINYTRYCINITQDKSLSKCIPHVYISQTLLLPVGYSYQTLLLLLPNTTAHATPTKHYCQRYSYQSLLPTSATPTKHYCPRAVRRLSITLSGINNISYKSPSKCSNSISQVSASPGIACSVCCGVLRCVAVCCGVLQCTAVCTTNGCILCRSGVQCVAVCASPKHYPCILTDR